jgi:hypothetical protein
MSMIAVLSRLLLAAAAAAVLVAGCSSASEDDAADEPAANDTPQPPPIWPLTGLEAADADADVDGPVLVVKVDNATAAFPQEGLDTADIVVEEPVEGGITRLAVLVHSDVAGTMGPVRSVRTSDIGIAAPADGVLVASGGAAEAVADLERAGVATYVDGSAGFSRDPSRAAPHNLFVDLDAVVAAQDGSGPPGEYFDFGEPTVLSDAEVAASVGDIALTFSPAQTTRLAYDGATWSRELDTPDGFSADTVVALQVEQDAAGYLDPSGAPVPINVTEGEGRGWLAHGGRIVDIEWSKPTAQSPWSFTVDDEAVTVAPGRTYLALLPQGTGSLQAGDPAGGSSGE